MKLTAFTSQASAPEPTTFPLPGSSGVEAVDSGRSVNAPVKEIEYAGRSEGRTVADECQVTRDETRSGIPLIGSRSASLCHDHTNNRSSGSTPTEIHLEHGRRERAPDGPEVVPHPDQPGGKILTGLPDSRFARRGERLTLAARHDAWSQWLATAADTAPAFPARVGERGRTRGEHLRCLTARDLRTIRALAARIERGHHLTSISAAVEIYAGHPVCPAPFASWAKARSSRHHLPPELADALAIESRVLGLLRTPGDDALDYGSFCPGALRLCADPRTGELRRHYAGEVWCGDDASINAIFWAPWGLGGDRCSDKWGVRVGRFQLLLYVDLATDMIVGWSWVIRDRASYRAVDIAGSLYRLALAHGAPREIILERGTWASHQVTETCEALGIEIRRSHSPRNKPVEGIFGRLWTLMSALPGVQIGRFRGGNEAGERELASMRAGSGADPRTRCLSLAQMDEGLMKIAAELNSRQIDSRRYGRWIPAERWAEDVAAGRAAMRAIDPASCWVARPERRKLTVRQGGLISCKVDVGFGCATTVDWKSEALWRHVGREVVVYFDPAEPDVPAAIVDSETHRCLASNVLSCTGDIARAQDAERAIRDAVRREVRALRHDGSSAGKTIEDLGTNSPTRSGAGLDDLTVPGRDLAPARTTRHRLSRTDEELDPELIDRLEREARERGLMTTG